ncbi:hypothetical protein DACRYDRAFT_114937 [Dacryopinax primogenitus]|uniref:SURF6-domain-containing protein n=1 Tax=Dacryopinax primogenitus (strain DJM 731) TaxID=1858805 RepID=M5G4D6_DACPD|nr:uncharacterized protein DACRYDRAFT_114937 [Dacryopinax primogenitus]EJU03559.1 hypothetical protein DACRYDRAFT_114937 [Dacryopinax primogenitus]
MAVVINDAATLRQSLERHNEVFSNLLKLIPLRYYIVENKDEIASKWQKNTKNQKIPKQEVKEATKKAKRANLDPANQKTTLDILREEEAAHEAKKSNGDVKGKGKRKAEEMESDDDEDDESAVLHKEPVPMGTGSITELRSKLHERIAALQLKSGRKRPGDETEAGEETDGMPSTKDELLEMRRKKRGEVRDKRRKETKERKAKERTEKEGKGKKMGVLPPPTKLLVPEPPKSRPETTFNVSVTSKTTSSSKAAKRHIAPSDPTQALAKLSKKQQALDKLDPEARKRREEQDRYEKAEMRIEGGKVHDDPARLKKAAKRKEKEKEKSKKDWDKRKHELQVSAAAKQKKRSDNLLVRNERRKDKKAGIKPKPGKARPGFEGKPMRFSKKKTNVAGKK